MNLWEFKPDVTTGDLIASFSAILAIITAALFIDYQIWKDKCNKIVEMCTVNEGYRQTLSYLNKKINGQNLESDQFADLVRFLSYIDFHLMDIDSNICSRIWLLKKYRERTYDFIRPISAKLAEIERKDVKLSDRHKFLYLRKIHIVRKTN